MSERGDGEQPAGEGVDSLVQSEQRSPASRQSLTSRKPLSGMQRSRTPEYLVIGHICADIHPDGKVVLGGTALYSAIAAARLGWRTAVLTRGRYGQVVNGHEIPGLDQFGDEISIIVQESDSTTQFINRYVAGRRTQELPAWGGVIDLRGLPAHWRNAKIIHLGPIAQEIDVTQTGGLSPEFLGSTPQGWMRHWPQPRGGKVTTQHLRLPPNLIAGIDGLVVSDEEISDCRDVVAAVGARRLSAITKGENGSQVIYGGQRESVPAYRVQVADYTGAGDTYAAAFFAKATDRSVSAPKAAEFASAVSALSLTGVGVEGIPHLAEVEAFMKTARTYPIRS